VRNRRFDPKYPIDVFIALQLIVWTTTRAQPLLQYTLDGIMSGNSSHGELQSSYFASHEDARNRPMSSSLGNVKNNNNNTSLNETIQTEHLDLPGEDNSFLANITRSISRIVGSTLTPRQVLGLLRVLKAITLSFLVLTILSDLMYILFVELLADSRLKVMAGGNRDIIIRFYGLGLSFLGLAIELDHSKIVRKFSGLKGFLPRSLLYLLIMQITGSHPIMLNYDKNDNNNNTDDDHNAYYDSSMIQIPSSAIGFQRVTSFVL
jgi:hypothetical protein